MRNMVQKLQAVAGLKNHFLFCLFLFRIGDTLELKMIF